MLKVLSFVMDNIPSLLTGLVIGFTASVFVKRRNLKKVKQILDVALQRHDTIKMIFVVRNNLGMTKGKVATQCAHAAVLCYNRAIEEAPEITKRWSNQGQTKIALKFDGSEEEFYDLAKQAKRCGAIYEIVNDAGKTQVKAGTATVLGIGPAPSRFTDYICGHLKLL